MSKYMTLKKGAFQLFSEYGFEGTSLNDIAVRAGIRKSSIYAHFKNKDELFLSIYKDIANHYQKVMREHFILLEQMNCSIQGKLGITFELYINTIKKDISISKFWKRAVIFPPKHLKKQLQEIHNLLIKNYFKDKIAVFFSEGIQKGDIKEQAISELIKSYFCLIDGAIFTLLYDEKQLDRHTIKSLWINYWTGISDIKPEMESIYDTFEGHTFNPLT
ncbi:TetR/AcrR family transcriptional regulator [Bacillus sp. J33]|uniref:TetR/AcrR family transcriptional regulator n=1 Tax=Bacillus sp. J33 TaxID=935836 RepID=UPI0004B1268F|nr:TetR/AcrR family transcriptional regulator [Bacillus sp. J33]